MVPLLKNLPMVLAALVAGGVALWLRELPHQLGLMLGSFAGITAGYMTRLSVTSKSVSAKLDSEISET